MNGVESDAHLPHVAAIPPPPPTRVIGYDVVSRSGGHLFECSPLSCNGGWQQFAVNEFCLFASLPEALRGAVTFSGPGWEPGPYFVVEVLRS